MLSTAADYALRAMACLAEHPETPLTSRDIASRLGIRSEYLSKVLGMLSRAGLITSRRGRGGGFMLARPRSELTVLDIIEAIEPLVPYAECPLPAPSRCDRLCALHELMNLALRDVARRFESVTLDHIFARDEDVERSALENSASSRRDVSLRVAGGNGSA